MNFLFIITLLYFPNTLGAAVNTPRIFLGGGVGVEVGLGSGEGGETVERGN